MEEVPVALDHSGESVVNRAGILAEREILAEIEGRECDCTAGVFLLGVSEKVGGVGELGFHLLFTVTVVVVRDEGDDHAALVPAGDFESSAVVVFFVRGRPAHAVLFLALAGVFSFREAEFLLREGDEMRGENDATGMAGPVLGIEAGVVVRKVGVSGISEDAFHEIQVGDEVARGEKADFHGFFRGNAGNFRSNDGAQEEGYEDLRGSLAGAGEGQGHDLAGRVQRGAQEAGEGGFRHFLFIRGNRQAAIGDVEDALGGAAVGGGVVADALVYAVGAEDGGLELVLVRRNGKHAGNPVTLGDQCAGGEEVLSVRKNFADDFLTEVGAQVGIDGGVGRAEVVGKEAGLFLEAGDQGFTEIEKRKVFLFSHDGVPTSGKLEVYELAEAVLFVGGGGGRRLGGEADAVFELVWHDWERVAGRLWRGLQRGNLFKMCCGAEWNRGLETASATGAGFSGGSPCRSRFLNHGSSPRRGRLETAAQLRCCRCNVFCEEDV